MRASILLVLAVGIPGLGLPLTAQVPSAVGDPEGRQRRATSVAHDGLTWRFAGEHAIGEFANGDPWVVGPVAVVAIEPGSRVVAGRHVHGSMLDPDPSVVVQGYDSLLFTEQFQQNYRPELDVGRGIDAAHPLTIAAGHSLVSVVSATQAEKPPTLQGAAVLTVVAAPPAPDAFRPPYAKGDKTVRFRAVDLDLGLLPALAPVPEAPNAGAYAPRFKRLWLDHFPSWLSRYAHPADNMPDYGRDMAATVGGAALTLVLAGSAHDKRELAIGLVQYGIDQFANLRGGCTWDGLGGHGSGRKLPILLAGLLLHDADMLAVGDRVSECRSSKGGPQFFGEDAQTFYVRETAPGEFNWGLGGYTAKDVGLPEWGFSHCGKPADDRVAWDGNPYRVCCTGNAWLGECLAARILGLQKAWNHPAFFDYLDRYQRTPPEKPWHRAWEPWQAVMWDRYRPAY